MSRFTKREFLGTVGAAAGVGFLHARGARLAQAAAAPSHAPPLWLKDATGLRVSRENES